MDMSPALISQNRQYILLWKTDISYRRQPGMDKRFSGGLKEKNRQRNKKRGKPACSDNKDKPAVRWLQNEINQNWKRVPNCRFISLPFLRLTMDSRVKRTRKRFISAPRV